MAKAAGSNLQGATANGGTAAQLVEEVEALARLNAAGGRLWRARSLSDGLAEMLEASIALLGADMGNIQIMDSARQVLLIASQRGFKQDFLDFFREVSTEDESACGRALRTGERIVIEDVESDAAYAPMRAVARAAGYRAVQSTPLVGRDGRALGMISTHWARVHRPGDQDLRRLDLYVRLATDFIDRFKMDNALARNERELADCFEHAPVGLSWIGPDGLILRANDAELSMLGYRADEYVGRPFKDFHAERAEADDFLERLTRAETLRGRPARLRRRDGSIRHVLVNANALVEDGELVHTRCFKQDITERKLAEDALRESEERFRTLSDSAPALIWVNGLSGCEYVNRGYLQFLGVRSEDVLGLDWAEYVLPEDRGSYFDAYQSAVRDRSVFKSEFRFRRHDGEYRWMMSIGQPRFAADGGFLGYAGVTLDVTENRRAEERRRLLVNELNHRVKNTLAVVQAIAHRTLAGKRNPEAFAESFGQRLQSLARVHSMLSGESWEGADLHELVRDQWRLGLADSDRLVVEGPEVLLDAQSALQLALVLHELMTNACKHGALSAPGGSVALNWTADGAVLRLCWIERGAPPASLPADRGFGVSLIEQSARSQGGDARMACGADGVSWRIALPLHRDPSAGRAARSDGAVVARSTRGAAEPSRNLAGRRLLVVEDEPLVGLDIVATLEDAEAQVEGPVGTEERALAMIERMWFDGVLLDANLHGRPVGGIAEALNQRNIPFVFVTGYGPEGLPEQFRHVRVLDKPFSRQQIIDAAADLVATADATARSRLT